MEKIDHQITNEDAGSRLDRFIRRHHPMINQGRIEKLLRGGAIRVDGAKAKSSTRITEGQVVTMPAVIMTEASKPKPQHQINPAVIKTVKESVIAKGKGWIALNKPSGLATQGGSGTNQHVDGALPKAFPEEEKLRLVHRLDRDTSGVLVVATNLTSARALAAGFQHQDHAKTYLALAMGVPKIKQGVINAPLAKTGGKGHERMMVDDDGQPAVTLYHVLDHMARSVSLIALRPKTGRTHQLRAHLASIGCPILGDGKYGGADAFPSEAVTRLCLHAAAFEMADGSLVTAPIPEDMRQVFEFFGLDADRAFQSASDPNCFED